MRLDVTDNPVISGMSRIFDMMCLNVLWLVCSLPIFTIGASTTAMYTVMLKVVKNEEGYIVKGFFKAFKENFKKSTIIWLILLVIGGFLGADLYLTSSAKGSVGMASRAIFAALELLVLAVGIYAFGLTARYENSIKGTIRNALTLTLARFPSSILMVAIMIALIGISIWNLQLITFALPFWALFGVSIIFWINSKLLRRIFAGIEDHTEEEVEE